MKPVVLITGATSGIGRAVAEQLAARDCELYLTGQSQKALAELQHSYPRASVIACNLTKEDEVTHLFAKIADHSGRLDWAINNAATEGAIAPITELTLDQFDQTFNLNVRSLWLCNQHQIKMMLQNQRGSIVNVASTAGLMGIAQSSLYCASKHAVVGLTKALALEWAVDGIRINAVCPGPTQTPMLERVHGPNIHHLRAQQPNKRIAEAFEIARAICWLVSDEASYLVGQALVVDGGFTAQQLVTGKLKTDP